MSKEIELSKRFFEIVGESTGTILGYAILYGIVWTIIRRTLIRAMSYIGIQYFSELDESYKWIDQLITEARALVNADNCAFYRINNHEDYREGKEFSKIEVYSIGNKQRNRGIASLPEVITDKYYDWFSYLTNKEDYSQLFTNELPIESHLRSELNKRNILAYSLLHISDGYDLYGVVVFTWSSVRKMPKGSLDQYREYLDDIKNSLLIEIKFLISRNIKYRIKKIIRWSATH